MDWLCHVDEANEGETADDGCHCLGDVVVHMCTVMVTPQGLC